MNRLKSVLKHIALRLGFWPQIQGLINLKDRTRILFAAAYIKIFQPDKEFIPVFIMNLLDVIHPSTPSGSKRSVSAGIALSALIKQIDKVEGEVAECGVHTGKTLVPLSILINKYYPKKILYGFDSWGGLPPPTAHDIHNSFQESMYKQFSQSFDRDHRNFIQLKLEALNLERTSLIKGFFDKTLMQVADRKFAFVHIDCDVYSSYMTVLNFFYPRLSPGGFMVFDDYSPVVKDTDYWPGAHKAVTEFLSDKSEKVLVFNETPFVNNRPTPIPRYFIRKMN